MLLISDHTDLWRYKRFHNRMSDGGSSIPLQYIPLGPRHEFPVVDREFKVASERNIPCNLMASVGTNPSRMHLVDLLKESSSLECLVHVATEWQNSVASETKENEYVAIDEYQEAIRESVFTLCPR